MSSDLNCSRGASRQLKVSWLSHDSSSVLLSQLAAGEIGRPVVWKVHCSDSQGILAFHLVLENRIHVTLVGFKLFYSWTQPELLMACPNARSVGCGATPASWRILKVKHWGLVRKRTSKFPTGVWGQWSSHWMSLMACEVSGEGNMSQWYLFLLEYLHAISLPVYR